MATIRIKRPPMYFGIIRKIKVWIDGSHVGDLPVNSEQAFKVSNGNHEIQVSMDWCKSKPLEIKAQANRETKLTIKTNSFLHTMLLCFAQPSGVFTLEIDENT